MSIEPERAVERLLDDETLRGNLEDDAFSPIINVASELAIARAGGFDETGDLYLALRDLVRGAVQTIETADRAALIESFHSPLASADEQQDLAARLPDLGGTPAENAATVASALRAALLPTIADGNAVSDEVAAAEAVVDQGEPVLPATGGAEDHARADEAAVEQAPTSDQGDARTSESPALGAADGGRGADVEHEGQANVVRRWWPVIALVAVLLVVVVGGIVMMRRAQQPADAPAASPPVAKVTPAPPGQPSTPGPAPAVASDWYAIYFTNPQIPTNPSAYHDGLDVRLVELIDRAQRTLDVADYDFDLMNVADAMARAKRRGVQVRMVTDSDTVQNTKNEEIQAALGRVRDAGIRIVPDDRDSIMHDKFTVVDGEWVSTGSWNYTTGDTYRLNNWMGIFQSKPLAANYTAEFEQMFSGKFSTAKRNVTPNPTITIDDTRLQNCFSPKGKCGNLVVDTIEQNARQSIYFLAFSFTHDGIGNAMLDKAKAGVKVAGVFETTGSGTTFSEYGKLKRANLDVYTDGNPYVMHHKVIVIDERITVAGSFNFSKNADEDNDENLLIVDNPDIARAFKAEFDRVLAVAKNPPAKDKRS